MIETVCLIKLCYMFLKPEMLYDFPCMFGKAIDVVGKIGSDVIWVALQLNKSEPAGVMKRLACNFIQDRFEIPDLAILHCLVLFEHLILGGFQHTIQSSQDNQKQHDILILVRPVWPPYKVRHRPDETRFFTEVVHTTSCP